MRDRLVIVALVFVLGIVLLHRVEPAQQLPLVKADFCLTVHGAPLIKPKGRRENGRPPLSDLA
jgi:hypothetical protein